jgi:ABC-type sugar transport system ATPase subunit
MISPDGGFKERYHAGIRDRICYPNNPSSPPCPDRAMTAPALTLHQLRKTYANGPEALRGIDLEVAEGEFFALLGPNGAGKSTTIGIICSLVRKSGGSVQVFGHDLDRELSAAKALYRAGAAGV